MRRKCSGDGNKESFKDTKSRALKVEDEGHKPRSAGTHLEKLHEAQKGALPWSLRGGHSPVDTSL